MTAETVPHQTVIHVHTQSDDPTRPQSFTLKEALRICRLSYTRYFERVRGMYGAFWKADNGDIKSARSRFHAEHVEYMVLAVNGIISEEAASDLWTLRKKAMVSEKEEKAMSALAAGKRKRGSK